jgi:hypothetical protein
MKIDLKADGMCKSFEKEGSPLRAYNIRSGEVTVLSNALKSLSRSTSFGFLDECACLSQAS